MHDERPPLRGLPYQGPASNLLQRYRRQQRRRPFRHPTSLRLPGANRSGTRGSRTNWDAATARATLSAALCASRRRSCVFVRRGINGARCLNACNRNVGNPTIDEGPNEFDQHESECPLQPVADRRGLAQPSGFGDADADVPADCVVVWHRSVHRPANAHCCVWLAGVCGLHDRHLRSGHPVYGSGRGAPGQRNDRCACGKPDGCASSCS
jgi:hypothetical protein